MLVGADIFVYTFLIKTRTMSLYVNENFNRTLNRSKKRQLICRRFVIIKARPKLDVDVSRSGICKVVLGHSFPTRCELLESHRHAGAIKMDNIKKYHQLALLVGIIMMVFLIVRGNDEVTANEATDSEPRVTTYFVLESGRDVVETILNFPRQLANILFSPSEAQFRFFLRDGFAIRNNTDPIVERIGQSHRNDSDELYMLTWQPTGGFVRRDNLIHEPVSTIPRPRYINSDEPIVYLFNSHPHEMIGAPNLARYREGTVNILEFTHMIANVFADYRIPVLVEDRDVRDVLNRNGWHFNQSYAVSRMFVEERYYQYPSLQFFFDIHRDGVPDSVARTNINGHSYARIVFVIGLENPHYDENMAMALRLHEMLETRRPGISRGIFPSSGLGRNAVYNQDFSPKMQLIEIGSAQSTKEEMMRTTQILAEILAEYILTYLY